MLFHYGKFFKIYLARLGWGYGLGALAVTLLRPSPAYAITTALGDIPTSAGGLASRAVQIGFRMVSGVGVVLVMWGAVKYNLSKGDPRALDEAKETIVAALAGLVIVALAAIVMGYLGADILGIPGLTRSGQGVSFPEN